MKLIHATIISMVMSTSSLAQDIKIAGTISVKPKQPAVQQKDGKTMISEVVNDARVIKLLKVTLSDKAKQSIAQNAKAALNKTNQFAPNALRAYGQFPSSIQLGMNDVPVLDQGPHGTCVTFAVSAAIDAALNKGDYVSQLCSLQLGNYLQENGYGVSGWDGSFGRWVLSQMDSFGFVSKAHEAAVGCGGVNAYPTNDMDTPDSSISLEDYHQISEPMLSYDSAIIWSPIMDFVDSSFERIDTNKTLAGIKTALANGDRVTFATLLLDFDLGFVGAVGKKSGSYDSWVLTPEIARDAYLNPYFGGHEMVITGYDDDAVAVDDAGRQHKGLLTLRNSWSNQYGDHGDFYMSYDYFKMFVMEAQRIRGFSWGDLGDDARK